MASMTDGIQHFQQLAISPVPDFDGSIPAGRGEKVAFWMKANTI